MHENKEVLDIFHWSCKSEGKKAAQKVAEKIGFQGKAIEEIIIIVCELASNLIKHADGGQLVFKEIREGTRKGMQIISIDKGPGITEIEKVFSDGFSTKGSLGYGLGTINRLVDNIEITSFNSNENIGTKIICKKWLKSENNFVIKCHLDIGVCSRPCPRMRYNGDLYITKRDNNNLLVGVIDGLGHGILAYKAAVAARNYIETHYEESLINVFQGVGRACRETRGVVMALAKINIQEKIIEFAGLGNIEAKLLIGLQSKNLISRRGVVGASNIKPILFEYEWNEGAILVLHSDGLKSHWNWQDFADSACKSSNELARKMFYVLAKENDDATIMVVK